jgi:hypothetical protein
VEVQVEEALPSVVEVEVVALPLLDGPEEELALLQAHPLFSS